METRASRKNAPKMVNRHGQSAPDGHAIRATLRNRILTILAVKFFKHFKSRNWASACLLPFGLVIKSSSFLRLAEANTTQFIAENTDIPVPKIYCAFRRKGTTYIVMQKMKGQWLGVGWNKRDEASRERVLAHLKTMLDQLRSLQPSSNAGIQNVVGGPLWDFRVTGLGQLEETFGPFPTVDSFHKYLRQDWEGWGPDYDYNATEGGRKYKLVLDMHRSETVYPLKFTHGDLNATNILVEGDEVTGIIDWACAGWYPSYWEFTNQVIKGNGDCCREEHAVKYLDPFIAETEAESVRVCAFER